MTSNGDNGPLRNQPPGWMTRRRPPSSVWSKPLPLSMGSKSTTTRGSMEARRPYSPATMTKWHRCSKQFQSMARWILIRPRRIHCLRHSAVLSKPVPFKNLKYLPSLQVSETPRWWQRKRISFPNVDGVWLNKCSMGHLNNQQLRKPNQSPRIKKGPWLLDKSKCWMPGRNPPPIKKLLMEM